MKRDRGPDWACPSCNRQVRKRWTYCRECKARLVRINHESPSIPEDAVEGAPAMRDPAHDMAVRIAHGNIPKEWLR